MNVDRKRFLVVFVAPALLVIGVVIAPLVAGGKTIYVRDVLNTHLEMKVAQAEAMRAGRLPLIDPYRAGGQPLAGNPNAVPFYPDNALYWLAPVFWALNAHFWLHWLVAPLAMFWLAREWGFGREASWAAGVLFATSGYFVSQLTFLNLVAVVALAPALIAAALAARRRRWAFAAFGALWALILLGGEPNLAGLALLLAASAFFTSPPAPSPEGEGVSSLSRRRVLAGLAIGLALGTLAAAPQIVELLRILPLSFRGHQGYTAEAASTQSFDPRQAIEWLLPFPFGRPDTLGPGAFWGSRYYGGNPPYFLSLYPGLLAIALALAAGRPRSRAERWAWAVIVIGLFLALGRYNPLLRPLLESGLLKTFRYPVKFWLLVGVGASLLCAGGFERALLRGEAESRRALLGALAALATLLGVVWLVFSLAGDVGFAVLRAMVPARREDAFVLQEQLRWNGGLLLSLVLLVAFSALIAFGRRRPWWTAAACLVIHAASQAWLLRPALPMDAVKPYLEPSPLLDVIPPDSLTVHGAFTGVFRHSTLAQSEFPDSRALWLERRAFRELYPFAGALWGRRFEMNVSPEGLDSFLTRFSRAAIEQSEDADRLRLLAAWGVDRLILDRELQPEAAPAAELLRKETMFGKDVFVYRLIRAVPEVSFAGTRLLAPSVTQGLLMLRSPDFDPSRMAVLAGRDERLVPGGRGTVSEVRRGADWLLATVDAETPGVLLWQRAHLPIYRATIDGAPAPAEPVNVHRLGVQVPAGRHTVRIWADRLPTRWAIVAGVLGCLGLAAFARRGARPAVG